MTDEVDPNTQRSGTRGVPWTVTLAIGAAAVAVLIVVFLPTVESAIYQWNTSSAYNYGYLIAPISAYLIWGERHALAVWRPNPTWLGLAVTAAFAGAWLLADVMGIDEGRHIGVVGMLQGIFLGMLGWRLYRRMAFPLVYLWLMVPTGEFLIEPMQLLAHRVAVWMLAASGIPVFGEGILIQVPTGNFLVEPGCAGLNFLLASTALALLYGKLTYRRWSTRLICLAVAAVVSILANFVRVYLIVAITEWTDRRIDISEDHLFYGWVFFGIVMMAMMWFGMRFKDTPDTPPNPELEHPSTQFTKSARPIIAVAVAAVLVASGAVALADLSTFDGSENNVALILPDQVGGWTRVGTPLDWQSNAVAGDANVAARYQNGDVFVDVNVTYYAAQVDGREAAAATNLPWDGVTWNATARSSATITVDNEPVAILMADIRGNGPLRIAVAWYESSGCTTSSRLKAKICAAADRLRGRPSPGAFVAMSTALTSNRTDSERALANFAAALDIGRVVLAAAPSSN